MRRALSFLIAMQIAMPCFAAVRGTVMTMEGAPLSGARVEAYLPETGVAREERVGSASPQRGAIAGATTDGGGNFSLDVKKQPVVIIAVDAPGFEPFASLAGGQEDLGAIALAPAPTVRGAITSGGKAVAGARLIFSSNAIEIVATSDAEGHYSVPDPSIWTPSLTIVHPDFATLTERAGGRKPVLNYQLTPGISIAGRVVGEDNSPVSGARVSAGTRRAVTAADGTFTLDHLPGKRPAITVTTTGLTGEDNKSDRSVLIKLHRAASISGTVRDGKTQKALAGARVATSLFDNTDSVLTDGNGAFTLPLSNTGRIRLYATFPNYSFAPVEVDVRAGQNSSKNLIGAENATITGTVIDEAKRAVPVARIVFSPAEDAPTAIPRRMSLAQSVAYSAPDGRFVLRNVVPDLSGEVVARRKGTPEGSAGPFKLASGEVKKGVGVVVPQGLTVTGRVVDREGRPLSGVAVIPVEPEDRTGGVRRTVMGMRSPERESNVETRKDGTFSLQLREGRYDFSFRRDGYATKRIRGITVNAAPQALEVTLEPGVEIRGRVVRSDGSGVPDVNINLMMSDSSGGEPIRTAADGSFAVPNLSPGALMLMAIKPDEFIREIRNVTAPADDLVIELPATGRIEGRVMDKESRRPIPQFAAGISQGSGNRAVVIRMAPMMKNFNNEDGSFVIENVPAGKVQLAVNAAGFVDAQLSNLMVEEGKSLGGVIVELEPGVRLFGKVTGSDGTPLADAVIRTEDDTSVGQFSPDRSLTDGSGEYSIEGMAPGEKTIVFQKDGYVPDRRTVKLSGRETRLDVRLGRGKDILGTVVDEQGMPIAGANVSARSGVQDAGFRTTRSDSSGSFRFEGLTPGRYTFVASKSGYVTGEAKDIDLDAAAAGVRITLTGGGTLFGHVSGLSDQELGSAIVTISGSGRGTSGPVDSSGNYRIDGVPTGTVRVSAATGRFPSQKTTPARVAEITPGSEVQVDLEFRSDVVIRGRITRQGKPVHNAMIVFDPRDARTQTRASGRTDGSGSYEVSGLESGNYGISVIDMAGGSAYDTTYQVNGSDTFDIEMRGAQLSGRVSDADTGAAVSDALVTLQNAEARGRFAGALETISDPSGNFTFETVSPGTYRIRAVKDRYSASMSDLAVGDTDLRDIDLKLARSDGIRLRVVDARDLRALRAFVWVRDPQGRTVYEGQPSPNTEGVIAVPVGPGSYKASVGAVGYAARTVTMVIPSQEIRIALSPGGTLLIQSKRDSREVGRLMTPTGDVFQRSPFSQRELALVPGTTTMENLAPGPYVLQLLDERGNVKSSYSVIVVEGQVAQLQI